ncbi:hypothetical protein HU200_002536 [Digitaria exilis]|uniref:Remorin C-terminal domain-containing protein n=1 Tax=Digitaria exilis TaxID=1010633 RepID=A0A835KTV0_9POAL|nr:hypothetical protein HU200_002536 [Digitaria exilis]
MEATKADVVAPAAGAGAAAGGPPVPIHNAAAAPADRGIHAVLAKVEMDRKLSMIKAWEESEKSKAENKYSDRAQKKMSSIMSWENTKKAAEKLEKKKAEYAEKMRNQIAAIHKEGEEKRASVEAKRHEAILKYEDMAAKHRSKGTTPAKKFLGCF